MSLDAALKRLTEERLQWSQNPTHGFVAFPYRDMYGDFNLMRWECFVPGKNGTIWQGARCRIKMIFNQCYPLTPPICLFDPVLYHPNVCPVGRLYMSLLDFDEWTVTVTIKDILVRIQEILDKPELNYAVQKQPTRDYKCHYSFYVMRVKAQVRRMVIQDLQMRMNNPDF